jgi:hypothetical protein
VKITLESTAQIVEIEVGGVGIPARVWEGTTASGIRVQALITRIAVHSRDDNSQFEVELVECPPKPISYKAFDARLIL